MNYQYLLDAASAGKDAVAAFQAGQRWTGVRHTGRAVTAVGAFGETISDPALLVEKQGEADPGQSWERILADNGNDVATSANVVFMKVKAFADHGRGSGMQTALGDKHPLLFQLLQVALKALIAALIADQPTLAPVA